MRRLALALEYSTLDSLIQRIDYPARGICTQILSENRALFESAQGSTYNHQAWKGGYIDHVTDGMNIVVHLYDFLSAFGRRLPFSHSDALLVFFLHDLEKPWRILVNEQGGVSNREGLTTKEEFQRFRESKLADYGLVLTPEQHNALTYVEGEHKDYTSKRRTMNELAAFCHMVDVWSARGWHDYPKEKDDEWTGAKRFRS